MSKELLGFRVEVTVSQRVREKLDWDSFLSWALKWK